MHLTVRHDQLREELHGTSILTPHKISFQCRRISTVSLAKEDLGHTNPSSDVISLRPPIRNNSVEITFSSFGPVAPSETSLSAIKENVMNSEGSS